MILTRFHFGKYKCFILIFCSIFYLNTYGQKDTSNIYDLTLTDLSKIQITSFAKVVQEISEVSQTIRIITSKEIKENGYFTLEEALSSLPGLQFRNVQGINSYIFMRGIPNQNNMILLLIDGVQINELNSGGFYGGGQYILSNIDRIEVLYGPASVIYGTNAVSGIINIITIEPKDNKLTANVTAGAFNTLAANVNYRFFDESNNLGINIAAQFKQTDKADLKGSSGDYNWTDDMENYEKDYSIDIKAFAGDFTFGTNYLQKQTPTSTQYKSVGTIYKDSGTLWNIRFLSAYLRYSKSITNNLKLTSMVYNRNTTVLDNSIYEIVNTAQVGYYRPNNLTGIEGVFDYKFNNYFSLTSGITFEYEHLAESPSLTYSKSPNEKPPIPGSPKMLNNTLLSIFVEPRAILWENVFLSAGVRFDNSSVYDQVLTPRFGLSYNFSKNTFRLSYSEAFRSPKPWDYTDGIGNSSLEPEKINSIEASLNFFLSDNFLFDVTIFNNHLKNGLVRETFPSGWKWINREEVNTLGGIVMFKYTSDTFKSSFNYSYTQSNDQDDSFIPEISKHTANASITYYFDELISLNVRANYIGERKNPAFIPTIDSYNLEPTLVFNCAITLHNYSGFDAQIAIKNIFDSEYYHTSNRTPERYRQSQRTVLFTIGYSLDL